MESSTQSSTDLAAVVGGVYAAFGEGNVAAMLEPLAEDVEWDHFPEGGASERLGTPWLVPRRGPAEVAEFFAVVGGMEINDFQVRSITAAEDRVFVEVSIDVTIPATGRRYRDDEVHVWVFNDEGRVSHFRHYTDTAKHAEAAGLLDLP
jgi:ketosteroid isomerase-like protein